MPTHSPSFPTTRLRRLRTTPWLRDLVAEVRLHPSDLILPLFVQEGKNESTPIASLPGVARHSVDRLIPIITEAAELGIPAVALFPATPAEKKDANGTEALHADNMLCRALREIKNAAPEIGLIADVALDHYTAHGHDGVLNAKGDVDNDATVAILAQQAVIQAAAGADIIAPSDMMDGRVAAIRAALDSSGYSEKAILAYSAKYASHLYGPFRDAVGSKNALGKADKRSYQMDFRNAEEALREIALDIQEGADMVMVKPALPYLDIIARASDAFQVPILAYQVSGEYAMLHAAAKEGLLDAQNAMLETLIAIKRAGARGILTYAAMDVAKALS